MAARKPAAKKTTAKAATPEPVVETPAKVEPTVETPEVVEPVADEPTPEVVDTPEPEAEPTVEAVSEAPTKFNENTQWCPLCDHATKRGTPECGNPACDYTFDVGA